MFFFLLKVEYYPPKTADGEAESDPESSSDPECDENEVQSSGKRKDSEHAHISDALASLGFYARSMKPSKNWLHQGNSVISLSPSSSLTLTKQT
jgi:phosphatidylinositol phospholipase C delta